MSFALADTATADLDSILEFIRTRDGLDRSLHVLDRFLDAFETLGATPGTGSLKPELTGDRIRWWRVFQYLVLYEATGEGVTILRIVHGARDLDRLFAEPQ